MTEYNKLTRRLLSEGYTAQNHPKYVKVAGGHIGQGDALNNIYGGFEYTQAYRDERVYSTPCGLLCKGRAAFDITCGEYFCHENDNPIIQCPKALGGCQQKPEQLRKGNNWCVVTPTEKPYKPEGSCEELQRQREAWKQAEKQKYIQEHPRHCKNHLRWDEEENRWIFQYDPLGACRTCGCSGGRFCPVLGRELRPDKGNIYFDIESECPDRSKDGTFFEGERIHSIITGNQYFDKPELLDICEAALKSQKDHIMYLIKTNKLPKLFGAWTLFQAELGKIDFSWSVKNMRAEKRIARDLEQDLKDIDEGVLVRNAAEEEKLRKQEKKERLAKAKSKREASAEKMIIQRGLLNMNASERKRATKLLGRDGVIKAQHEHDAEVERQKTAPVQLSLFDIMTEQEAQEEPKKEEEE